MTARNASPRAELRGSDEGGRDHAEGVFGFRNCLNLDACNPPHAHRVFVKFASAIQIGVGVDGKPAESFDILLVTPKDIVIRYWLLSI